jgi:phosphoserine aminotransferase
MFQALKGSFIYYFCLQIYYMTYENSPFRGLESIHNFNAGPSILPKEVFEQASQSVLNYNDTGLSILEIGHRTPLFQEIMDEARSLVKELMELDNEHEVLFLHGGASTQFMQVPMNLLNERLFTVWTER